jgi:hypothetical protein
MANLVTISDFEGSFQLQVDTRTTAKFNLIRDEYQNDFIYDLLGADLGALFLADLDANGVPQSAIYEAIYEPFTEDTSYGQVVRSKGIKEAVKAIVWYHFVRQNNHLVTTSGNTVKRSENADVSTDPFYLAQNYNKAIESGYAIQWYINENLSDYPEYNGQELEYLFGL